MFKLPVMRRENLVGTKEGTYAAQVHGMAGQQLIDKQAAAADGRAAHAHDQLWARGHGSHRPAHGLPAHAALRPVQAAGLPGQGGHPHRHQHHAGAHPSKVGAAHEGPYCSRGSMPLLLAILSCRSTVSRGRNWTLS